MWRRKFLRFYKTFHAATDLFFEHFTDYRKKISWSVVSTVIFLATLKQRYYLGFFLRSRIVLLLKATIEQPSKIATYGEIHYFYLDNNYSLHGSLMFCFRKIL